MRSPEEEAIYRDAEARCSLFMNRGIICRDCECGNENLPYNRDTSPAPWSHKKIKAVQEARAAVVSAARALCSVQKQIDHELLAAVRALDAVERGEA